MSFVDEKYPNQQRRPMWMLRLIGGTSLLILSFICITNHSNLNNPTEYYQNQNRNDDGWYDCSEEEGIDSPVFQFSHVCSVPAIVTPTSGQTIYKTITYYTNDDTSTTLNKIVVDFHQYYKLFSKTWMTFLIVHNVDECKEHAHFCPFLNGTSKNLTTIHPPLNKLTPYGWYRSRQVYKNPETGKKLGCVDMQFQYAREQDKTANELATHS